MSNMMKQTNSNSTRRAKQNGPESKEVVPIQVIKTPRGTMNHSYRDFSRVRPEADFEHPQDIKQMTFSQKVHHILSEPDFEKWISWMPHGRAFKVHVPVMFENRICPKYFGHKRYSSFLRDLNNYGFKHISKGTDRNCYYHEFMLKDRPHLCQYMPPCKDARRLVADPLNEPNFYRISRQYPLDGEAPAQEAVDNPPAKRARSDSIALPQGLALGAASLGSPVMSVTSAPVATGVPGPTPAALLGLIGQAATAPASPSPPTLLSLLEAQNQQRQVEKQVAMIVTALLQQKQNRAPIPPPVPSSNEAVLSAVLGLLTPN